MISVIICRQSAGDWEIDTWLMSCRVLKRRVEEAVLARLTQAAKAAGAKRLIGRFVPSGRNDLVQDHFAKLGFLSLKSDDPTTLWVLDVAAYEPSPDLPFTVID